MLSLERTEDGFSCALLPDTSGLLVTQQRISIVDAGQAKVQPFPFDYRIPDNSGVAEGAVGHHNRHTSDGVIDDMMIAHCSYRVGARMSAEEDRQHHVIGVDGCFVCVFKCGRVVGMKHLLEDVYV